LCRMDPFLSFGNLFMQEFYDKQNGIKDIITKLFTQRENIE
jgi:hypothetical protein